MALTKDELNEIRSELEQSKDSFVDAVLESKSKACGVFGSVCGLAEYLLSYIEREIEGKEVEREN